MLYSAMCGYTGRRVCASVGPHLCCRGGATPAGSPWHQSTPACKNAVPQFRDRPRASRHAAWTRARAPRDPHGPCARAVVHHAGIAGSMTSRHAVPFIRNAVNVLFRMRLR